jgi:putative ABC transport system ATP-binding protein
LADSAAAFSRSRFDFEARGIVATPTGASGIGTALDRAIDATAAASANSSPAATTANAGELVGAAATLRTPDLADEAEEESFEGSGSGHAVPPHKDPNNLIILRNVAKTYLLGIEGVPALRGVSLTVRRGEFVVILGKSGSGKTSLLNVVGTIDKPSRGDLFLCGVRVDAKTPDAVLADLRLRKLAFVFQTFNLLPQLTAVENVELPMVLAGWGTPARRRERAIRLLKRVGLGERLHHTPDMCSGGEQQRTTIARALANRPEILIGDESTGDLDQNSAAIVMKMLTDLNTRSGMTVIFVTHEVSLKAYAHRVVHMLDGKISRVEAVPGFLREDALEALALHPAVQAMERMKAARRRERRAARGFGAGAGVGAAEGRGSTVFPLGAAIASPAVAAGRAGRSSEEEEGPGRAGAEDGSGSDSDSDFEAGYAAESAAAAHGAASRKGRGAGGPRDRSVGSAGSVNADASGSGGGGATLAAAPGSSGFARRASASQAGMRGRSTQAPGGGVLGWVRGLFGGSGAETGRPQASAASGRASLSRSASRGSQVRGAGVDAAAATGAAGRVGERVGAGAGHVAGTRGGSSGALQRSGSSDPGADGLTAADDVSTARRGSGADTATRGGLERPLSGSQIGLRVDAAAARSDGAGSDAAGASASPPAGVGASAAAGGANTNLGAPPAAGAQSRAYGVAPAPLPSTASALNPSSLALASGGATSTGLTGVAAISHAIFAAQALGLGPGVQTLGVHAALPPPPGFAAGGSAGAGAAAAPAVVLHAPGSKTVVRTPAAYATFNFAQRSKVQAAQEEAQRRAAAAERERALLARVAAQAEARHAALRAAQG